MFYLNISVLPTSSKLDGLKQQLFFIVDDSAGWPLRLGLAGLWPTARLAENWPLAGPQGVWAT